MLAFVTSIKHPENSDDYAVTEELLRKTLCSIAQQTTAEYAVIIVGNRKPSFDLPERTIFVPVDFPPPARAVGPHANREGFVRDKGTKVGVGLLAARRLNPTHVMIFDADDFVHRDLTDFVLARPTVPGWVIDKGWVYSRARNGFRKQPSFHRTCGTSYIIPFDAYGVPDDLDETASQEEVEAAYGDVLPSIMGAHRNAVQWHRDHGRELEPVPFRAAVYHVDTGENHSGKSLTGLIRPWDRRLAECFAIESQLPALPTLFRCIGPRAITQSAAELGLRVLRRIRRLVLPTGG